MAILFCNTMYLICPVVSWHTRCKRCDTDTTNKLGRTVEIVRGVENIFMPFFFSSDNNTVLTDNHLNLVRENLARQWKHCARKLGFSDPEIDEIDHDYERDGLKEKVYQMLLKWGMREGSKGATVGKLAKALFSCQRLDLLTSLMQMNEE